MKLPAWTRRRSSVVETRKCSCTAPDCGTHFLAQPNRTRLRCEDCKAGRHATEDRVFAR